MIPLYLIILGLLILAGLIALLVLFITVKPSPNPESESEKIYNK